MWYVLRQSKCPPLTALVSFPLSLHPRPRIRLGHTCFCAAQSFSLDHHSRRIAFYFSIRSISVGLMFLVGNRQCGVQPLRGLASPFGLGVPMALNVYLI